MQNNFLALAAPTPDHDRFIPKMSVFHVLLEASAYQDHIDHIDVLLAMFAKLKPATMNTHLVV